MKKCRRETRRGRERERRKRMMMRRKRRKEEGKDRSSAIEFVSFKADDIGLPAF